MTPEQLLKATPHSLPLPLLLSSLQALPPATRLVTCANLVLSGKFYDQTVLRQIIEVGEEAGASGAQQLEDDLRSRLDAEHVHKNEAAKGWAQYKPEDVRANAEAVLGGDQARIAAVHCLAVLREARRRIDTFDAFYAPRTPKERRKEPSGGSADIDLDDPWAEADEDTGMLDDPWAENDPEPAAEPAKSRTDTDSEPETEPPIDAATFVLQDIVLSALGLATAAHMKALRVVCQRHAEEIWPYRLSIIESVPGWVSPASEDMQALLPASYSDGERSQWPPNAVPTEATLFDVLRPQYGMEASNPVPQDLLPQAKKELLSEEQLSHWYQNRVMALDELGLLDAQLAWVQHGAALGVSGLDIIGEDLSLLSRLIYDSGLSPQQQEDWSLELWRKASEETIVRAYLSNSSQSSIVNDIRRLVLPYLYVLQSRSERAGNNDPDLVERMLFTAILELPLSLALPCFEASKATLPMHQRLIKDDQAVARLALAILYGSDALNAWGTMSAIFECLPVWEDSTGDKDLDSEAVATTLESIASFMRPSTTHQSMHAPKDLFMFFRPLPFSSLSKAIDILDLDLESGEILNKWNLNIYLRELLQFAYDHDEQHRLAEKLVRKQATSGSGTERMWLDLWQDMVRLQGRGDESAIMKGGALGELTREEMMSVFLSGLLAAGSELSWGLLELTDRYPGVQEGRQDAQARGVLYLPGFGGRCAQDLKGVLHARRDGQHPHWRYEVGL